MKDSTPVTPPLGGAVRVLLVILRIYVMVAVPLVAYTFVHTLRP